MVALIIGTCQFMSFAYRPGAKDREVKCKIEVKFA